MHQPASDRTPQRVSKAEVSLFAFALDDVDESVRVRGFGFGARVGALVTVGSMPPGLR
jgi:hypothetical protein